MYDLGEDGKGKLPRVYHVCKALATFILLVKHKGTISMIAEPLKSPQKQSMAD